jgi:hypothetical protein
VDFRTRNAGGLDGLAQTRWMTRVLRDSRSPSGGSGPESAAESTVGRVGTSTARIISIPLGASESSSRAALRPVRPAS